MQARIMALARQWRQGGLVVAADDGESTEDVDGVCAVKARWTGDWLSGATGGICLLSFWLFRFLARSHFFCAFSPKFEFFFS